jgi:type II secretory pathway pseudopilin PulG
LIELLTVIAIIAVLATLLSSSLASAKRKARKSISISNLRQIVLGFQLYADDHEKRPNDYRALVANKYLSGRTLACPEDRTTNANWAGLLGYSTPIFVPATGTGELVLKPADVPHSYFESFDWADATWELIEKSPLAGIAACQLHGIGRPEWEHPAIAQLQGLVLRGVKDGSVIARQVYWKENSPTTGPLIPGATYNSGDMKGMLVPLPFFLDPTE